MATPERCSRCRRGFPGWDASEAFAWEGSDDEKVCPGCVTGAEHQAIKEDMEELAAAVAACHRCGRSRPEADDPDFENWEVLSGGEFACPGCLTHLDHLSLDEEIRRALGSGEGD